MTYCVELLRDEGLVIAFDCRTNAGVDHISTYTLIREINEYGTAENAAETGRWW